MAMAMATAGSRRAAPIAATVLLVSLAVLLPLCMSADVDAVNRSTLGGAVTSEIGSERAAVAPVKGSPEYLRLFVEETTWYNDLVLGPWLPVSVREKIPHTLQTWLRNYVAGLILYFVSGGLWCLYVYTWKGEVFFPAGEF